MKKKEYMKPAMRVVLLQHQSYILAGSLRGASTNIDDDGDDIDDIIYGGGGSYGAR